MIGYVAAGLGGAVGALARWGVSRALPHDPAQWPWATLAVNLSGCLLIGLLLPLLAAAPASPWLRPFLVTGVLGGYTTYSAFAVETTRLAEAGAWWSAGSYLVASVLGGLLAVVAGLVLGRIAARRA